MASDKITAAQVLLPVSLLSFVVALFLGFQTTLMVNDRNVLRQTHAQQDAPLQQAEKIKTQVNALAVGTLKLARGGNKDAQTIIGELKKAGIDVSDQPAGAPSAQTPRIPMGPSPMGGGPMGAPGAAAAP